MVADPEAAVRIDERGPALWVTLNRPDSLNALDGAVARALRDTLIEIRDDGRPLVITGAGRAFCAGGDLKFFLSLLDKPKQLEQFFKEASEAVELIYRYPGVTIAAVNGLAVAGGLELVCACDLAIAASQARFADGHVNYGVVPAGGATGLLPAIVGERWARWLLLSGEFISAHQAERMGLINQVVDDGQLESAVQSLAEALAQRPPGALRRIKGLLVRDLREVLARERQAVLEQLATAEAREGLSAFAARQSRGSGGGSPA